MAWTVDDYRQHAYKTAAGHREAVDAVARMLHANESLDKHLDVSSKEPCVYCWLRAGKAVWALVQLGGGNPLPSVPLSQEEALLAIIREHGDRWTVSRAMQWLNLAGWHSTTTQVRRVLREMESRGQLRRVSETRLIYELEEGQ